MRTIKDAILEEIDSGFNNRRHLAIHLCIKYGWEIEQVENLIKEMEKKGLVKIDGFMIKKMED